MPHPVDSSVVIDKSGHWQCLIGSSNIDAGETGDQLWCFAKPTLNDAARGGAARLCQCLTAGWPLPLRHSTLDRCPLIARCQQPTCVTHVTLLGTHLLLPITAHAQPEVTIHP